MDGGVRPDPARRSRGATRGSCGPAATTASGTASPTPASAPRLPEDRSRPTRSLKYSAATTAGRISAWSTSPASRRPTGPGPEALRPVARQAPRRLPARSVRERAEVSGRRRSARAARTLPVGSYYGYATGIVGLRLFPNPDFDEAAAKKWDPERYYTDRGYYNSQGPGASRTASACRAASATSGRTRSSRPPIRRIRSGRTSAPTSARSTSGSTASSSGRPTRSNFIYQLLHTSRPGSARHLARLHRLHQQPAHDERGLQPGPAARSSASAGARRRSRAASLNNRQFNDYVKDGPLTEFFQTPDTVWTPRVLKDGSDSVGALGALNRVYLNIGLFSEEWLLHFNALVGGKPITPIEIAVAQKNSAYWQATEAQTPNMALFFLRTRGAPPPEGRARRRRLPDHGPGPAPARQGRLRRALRALPLEQGARAGGRRRPRRLRRARLSRLLEPLLGVDQDRRVQAEDAADRARRRLPRRTTTSPPSCACPSRCSRPTPAARWRPTRSRGNIWDNFSSQSYKDLPSVGTITVHDPLTGEPRPYQMPAGGRGYTRPASLVSVWSTAPFLLNNSVGKFEPSPSVEARMRSFQDSIEKLLWPEKRRPRTRCSATRCPASSTGRPSGATSGCRRATSRTQLQPLLGPLQSATFPGSSASRRHRDRPHPGGHAGEPAGQPRPAAGRRRPRPGAPSTTRKLLAPAARAQAGPEDAVRRLASDEEARRAFAPLAPRCSRSASARTSSSTAATTSARARSRKSPA